LTFELERRAISITKPTFDVVSINQRSVDSPNMSALPSEPCSLQ
jgi:hypothetical protein